MMGKISGLEDLLTAHDEYVNKRDSLEKYISNVFSENQINILDININRKGFTVRCENGYYLLDNFSKIMEAFPDYTMAFDYTKEGVKFDFVTC